MAGRGPQSFKKRQKEQARKEKQQEKVAKRLERKRLPGDDSVDLPLSQVPFGESPLDGTNVDDYPYDDAPLELPESDAVRT